MVARVSNRFYAGFVFFFFYFRHSTITTTIRFVIRSARDAVVCRANENFATTRPCVVDRNGTRALTVNALNDDDARKSRTFDKWPFPFRSMKFVSTGVFFFYRKREFRYSITERFLVFGLKANHFGTLKTGETPQRRFPNGFAAKVGRFTRRYYSGTVTRVRIRT